MKRFINTVKRFLVVSTAFASLLFASCNNMVQTEDGLVSGEKVKVKLSASLATDGGNDESARTAYPVLYLENFKSFSLKCDGVVTDQWGADPDSGLSAYKMMCNSDVELTAGEHTLELTGIYKTGVLYKKQITQNIQAGTLLEFRLQIAKVETTEVGYLSLDFTFGSISSSTKITKVGCSMYETVDGVTCESHVSGTEYSHSTNGSLSGWNSNISYSYPAGIYILKIKFYTNSSSLTSYDLLLGEWDDVVYILPGETTTYAKDIQSLNKSYSISFNINGGSGVSSLMYYSSHNDITLPVPAKSNLTFAGWYTDADFTGEPVTGWEKYTHAEDMSLYAKWTYDLTFNANGSTDVPAEGEMNVITSLEGAEVTLPACGFTREGYVFKEWNTNASGTGTTYLAGEKFTSQTHLTLYAIWMECGEGSHAVAYFANGGSHVDMQVVEDGATLTEPVTEKTGYDFAGWFLSSDGGVTLSETPFTFGEDGDTVTENIALYAVWSPKVFNITYYTWNASEDEQVFTGTHESGYALTHTYGIDTELDSPTAPDSDSHFVGWYRTYNGTGTPVTSLGATEYLSDINLYARYIKGKYHVKADGDDTAGNGTALSPYATITRALSAIQTQNFKSDYQIIVHGEIFANVTLSTSNLSSTYVKSLLICGATGNDTDKINGNASGTVLTITTNVPVTLKNITITNGKVTGSSSAGGILLNNSACILKLETGVLITNNVNKYLCNSSWYYYGYYSGAAGLFIYNGSVVMEDGAEITANKAASAAGGLMLYGGQFTMNGGVISENIVTASQSTNYYFGGAGVYIFGKSSGTEFTMNGGEIKNNAVPNAKSNNNGGGGIFVYSTNSSTKIIINDGLIEGNNATYGGGIYVYSWSSRFPFEVNGGVISNNNAEYGGAVNLNGSYCSFALKGNVYIPAGEDCKNTIRLDSGELYLSGEVTAQTPIATIEPDSYSEGTILIHGSPLISLTQELVDKFAVKSDGTPWNFVAEDGNGKIRRPDYTITYKEKNGEDLSVELPADSPLTHKYGTATNLPVLEKEGYVFQGWYKDAACKGEKVTSIGAAEILEPITLYTYFTHETVSLLINNSSLSVTAEEEDGVITITACDGYRNYWWEIDGDDPEIAVTGAQISDDRKSLTFNKANLSKGLAYTVVVHAINANNLSETARVTVKKQEAE